MNSEKFIWTEHENMQVLEHVYPNLMLEVLKLLFELADIIIAVLDASISRAEGLLHWGQLLR